MASSSAPDPDREYRLIEQLELRIASANTDKKFEAIIQKFLSALLLKLASDNARNRNLTVKICQHVNQRLKLDASISLPAQSLLKTLRESESPLVKRFSLIFIEQALGRLPSDQRSNILPDVLRSSIPEHKDFDTVQSKTWSVAFDFLLGTLKTWRVPDRATSEETKLKDTFQLSDSQTDLLSDMLSNFISYDSKTQSARSPLATDFEPVFERNARSRSQVIVPIAKLLHTSIFTDSQRFLSAVLLSVDANDAANGLADMMFKQCNFDLEQESSIDTLFALFDWGLPKLQIKILSLLARSQKSTERTVKILDVVEKQLFQDGTGLEATKLRSAVFSYLTWAVRISSALFPIKERLQVALKEFIELQGWPSMSESSVADIDLREKAYESIGLLASIKEPGSPTSEVVSLDLITWLFTGLRCDTTRGIRASVDESLGRILNVASFTSSEDVQRLKSLLLWNMKAKEGEEDPIYFFPSINTTRYIAVRFANKCLPFSDIDARYINVLALGSNDRREVVEEGTRGLDPYWHTVNARLSTSDISGSDLVFPDFTKFISRVFSSSEPDNVVLQSLSSLTAAVTFGRNSLINEALQNSGHDISSQPDWDHKLQALITNDLSARQQFRQHLLQADSTAIVRLIENAILGMSLGSYDCASVALDLVSLCSNSVLSSLKPESMPLVNRALTKNAVQTQATRVLGIVASLSQNADNFFAEALSGSNAWSTAVGEAAVSVRAFILCAGSILSRMSLRGSQKVDTDMTESMYKLASEVILGTHDQYLRQAAYSTVGQMCLCLPRGTITLGSTSDLMDKLIADAKKEDEVAATTLGRIFGAVFSDMHRDEQEPVLERILGLHEVRKAEFQFALGEALTTAALGFRSASTLSEFDVDSEKPDWGYHPELYNQLVERSMSDSKQTKPSLKKASAIWLLSLIQYCDEPGLLQPHLRDCQAAFARLLNDRDEVVQETGSRGLSLVYEKGDKALRDDLVRDLVQSFTGGNTKLSGSISEDTQLFEAGALPTEGGQSVQTYKDIVSLATEMGDPSLVYRFMNLASNNAIWSSRAAFGRFGLSGILADSTYLTENKKFYPKLFRYRFDPNPNVQRSMDDIWKALVKDPKKTIDENFDLIMSDLLKSVVSGKEWRAREASCAAISDLIQGREIEKFERYLDEIWDVAFKVLDDVKETVRIAAMKLCRTLTGMLVRNLEVGEGSTKRATAMMQHAIPFLLDRMESGAAQEVQQYAIVTLLEVVKKSPLRSLRKFGPDILEKLVLSLSSLEHESINYLHLNADKYGLTAEKLDKMRVSSINASPVSEAIERCIESVSGNDTVDPNTSEVTSSAGDPGRATDTNPYMIDAMRRLEGAFKTAIGLPSKVGLSRVMITLVVRHQNAFRPFADRFVQLTRKYILDRNATISVSFSMALGYLVRLASEKEVNETSQYAQKLYFESQELGHRAVAGEIIQAISKASNDVFLNAATIFLPFAFIGCNDLDADVRSRFEPAWKDNVGGSRALNLYLGEIVSLISKHIISSLWPIKQACCLAVAEFVSSMDGVGQYTEVEARLLWPVMEESLSGKTWSGKEKVILAYPIFVKRARPLWEEKGAQMEKIAMREAKRTNTAYRPHALASLGGFASSRPDLELETGVLDVLTNVFDEMNEDGADRMEVDGDQEDTSQAGLRDATITAAIKCLFQSLRRDTNAENLDRAMSVVRAAHGKQSVKSDIAICEGARQYIARATATATQAGAAAAAAATHSGGQARNPPTQPETEEPFAAFLQRLVLAAFPADHDFASDSEMLRKSRADLALTLAETGMLSQAARTSLLTVLRAWARAERSRPLRMELEKVIAATST